MLTINTLPTDVLRIIFVETANPKIAGTCRTWRKIMISTDTVKAYLEKYEHTLGRVLYQQFIQRMHQWEFKSYDGFKSLVTRQFSLISHWNNGSKTHLFTKDPLSPLRIFFNEKHIADQNEIDLYSFALTLLKKQEVRLQDEGFNKGIQILIENHHISKDRHIEILHSKAGSRLWQIMTECMDLSVVKTLTLESPMMAIPRQIAQLAGLELLRLNDSPVYIPAEVIMLPKLKVLDLGRNKKHYLAPEIYQCDNKVIKDAVIRWQSHLSSNL